MNEQLIYQSLRLIELGAQVERERERLKTLVADGVSYDSKQMKRALARFERANARWKELEREHLALRARISS